MFGFFVLSRLCLIRKITCEDFRCKMEYVCSCAIGLFLVLFAIIVFCYLIIVYATSCGNSNCSLNFIVSVTVKWGFS
jgi:hypothetical protein